MTAQLAPAVDDQDHRRGPADAPVVFVEYGDYECPHCRQAHGIVSELHERLGDRFSYVFRHFPIRSSHIHAQHAAEAAEAAAAQGKFWEMHDKLFANQDALDDESLIRYAAEIGLDVERFKRELAERVYAERVNEDFRSGVRSGANGTPTFYINGERYDGPWDVESLKEEIERPLGVQVRSLFQRFARLQASGGILLLAAAMLALIWANSGQADSYFQLLKTDLAITFGGAGLTKPLLKWINDGLMALFFFIVGLEIKREITVGELASPRRAALPLMAALGGMIGPAAIYTALNFGTEGMVGWAVPMATDIAFMLGLMALLGRRVPFSLRVFFTALAIGDDLGAVLVLAIFYTTGIAWSALGAAAVIVLILVGLNALGVRNPLPYALLGLLLWVAFVQSGLHATIAGVVLALTIPARTRVRAEAFMAQCVAILGGVEPVDQQQESHHSDRRQAAAHALEAIAERMQSPAQRLEHALTPWATFFVLPIFALANAGVSFSGGVGDVLSSQVALGVILGLLVGKPLGITFFTWLAVRLGIGEMPARVEWPQLISATFLAGIGFTMALFIGNAAFDNPVTLDAAKLGILLASLLSGVIGFGLLSLTSHLRDRHSDLETAPAAA
ncbi:MAG: Na+/H+ antiporter NhaA [Anaerolineales bacterium]|jgi:NhaA family Na+:H+ antiporter